MIAKASMKHRRGSAQKARLVADMIRGKRVEEALSILRFSRKSAARDLAKLLNSAVANAESKAAETRDRIETDEMIVETIQINGGPTGRRYQPAARGRATRIRKRTSHVDLRIADA